MNLEEAQEAARELIAWAKERWGVQTEKQWICPNEDYHTHYEGYCPNDGRKLKKIIVESQSQDWRYKLQDFIDLPEYPAEPEEPTP